MYLQEDKRWDQYVVSVLHRSTVYVSSGISQKRWMFGLEESNTGSTFFITLKEGVPVEYRRLREKSREAGNFLDWPIETTR